MTKTNSEEGGHLNIEPEMLTRSVRRSDYARIIESDKEVYPTANPVTEDVLDQWYKNNPEFGSILEQHNELRGMCIAIPLTTEAWKKLVSGDVSESELHGSAIFDASKDNEIGIHIYHLEKSGQSKGFYKDALWALGEITHRLKRKNPALRIIGFSGLCTSPQGISLFQNKFNCQERDFVNREYVLRKDGRAEVFHPQSEQDLRSKLADGYECICRCKMLVLYPEEASVVWDYLN